MRPIAVVPKKITTLVTTTALKTLQTVGHLTHTNKGHNRHTLSWPPGHYSITSFMSTNRGNSSCQSYEYLHTWLHGVLLTGASPA